MPRRVTYGEALPHLRPVHDTRSQKAVVSDYEEARLKPRMKKALATAGDAVDIALTNVAAAPDHTSIPIENQGKLRRMAAATAKWASSHRKGLLSIAGIAITLVAVPFLVGSFFNIELKVGVSWGFSTSISCIYCGIFTFNMGRQGFLSETLDSTIKDLAEINESARQTLEADLKRLKDDVQKVRQKNAQALTKQMQALDVEIVSMNNKRNELEKLKELAIQKPPLTSNEQRVLANVTQTLESARGLFTTLQTTEGLERTFANIDQLRADQKELMNTNKEKADRITKANSSRLTRLGNYIKENPKTIFLFGCAIAMFVAACYGAILLGKGQKTVSVLGPLSVPAVVGLFTFTYYFWAEAHATNSIKDLQSARERLKAEVAETKEFQSRMNTLREAMESHQQMLYNMESPDSLVALKKTLQDSKHELDRRIKEIDDTFKVNKVMNVIEVVRAVTAARKLAGR